MNAMLNIQVRVLGQQAAAQIKAMQGQLNALQKQTARNNVAAGAFNSQLGRMNGLEKFGKNLQWTGRQLEYNFTLPLVIAGAMSTKWALDNEKAMVRVRKVYGDLGEDVGGELKALEKSFQLLSNRFGVHLNEVTDIGAAWAQTGAAGVALSKATRLTLEAMIIGEMEATEATEGLIAVQSAYRFNTNELRDALADLNIVENQTAVGFGDLITIITRAGGAARTAGISHEYLAAMSASLVPATGSAARAGASLRTIFSRLLAPTRQASELLKEIGIDVHDATWAASNGVKRIEMLSTAFMGLTQSQQAIVSSTVASRWQINRFDTLMRDVFLSLDAATRGQSAYGRALDATSDQQRANAIYARELATVLSSSPRAFQILTTNIKNAMAEAILPLLPVLISLLNSIRGLITGFNNLSPEVQNLALSGLFLLAVIGPLGRYVGSFILLGTTLGHAFHFAGRGVMFFSNTLLTVIGLLLAPFKLAFQGMIAIASVSFGLMAKAMSTAFIAMGGLTSRFLSFFIGAMRIGFAAAVSGIHTVLVGGLTPALAGAAAALGRTMATMGLMVTRTAAVIHTAWGLAITGIGRLIASLPLIAAAVSRGLALSFTAAAAASQGAWVIFQRFIATMPLITAAVWQGIQRVWAMGYAALRVLTVAFQGFMAVASAAIAVVIANPLVAAIAAIVIAAGALIVYFRDDIVKGIITAFNNLPTGIHATLMSVLRMIKQFALAVYDWLSYLNPFARHSPSLVDNVTRGVTTILDQYSRLNGVKAVIKEAISAHNAFLAATGAASRNLRMEEYQQKKADIVAVSPGAGPAVDRLIGSINKMRGALASVNIELQAQQRLVSDLERDLATAMKPYNDAIFENEMAQKKLRLEILKMKQAGQSVDDLKKRYAMLAGEIEKLRGNREELRLAGAGSDVLGVYDEQLKGLEAQRNAMEGMTSPIDDVQKKLDELALQGEILKLERDIKFDPQLRELDMQREKLAELQDAWDGINNAILDLEDSLNRLGSEAAQKLADDARKAKEAAGGKVGVAVEDFRAAGTGDFPVPGGTAPPGLGREGGLPEIEDFNKELEKELEAALDNMGSFDMFEPFKQMWNDAWRWILRNVGPYVEPVWEAITDFFSGLDWRSLISNPFESLEGVGGTVGDIFESIAEVFDSFLNIAREVWDFLGEIFGPVFEWIGDQISKATGKIGGELRKWGELFDPAIEAIGHIANAVEWAFKYIITPIFVVTLASIVGIWKATWPVLAGILTPILDAIVNVIVAGLQIIRGVIGFVLNLINGDWGAAWESLLTIVGGAWDAIYTVIALPVKLIWGIIKGLVEGIVGFFTWLFDILVGNSIIPDMMNAIVGWFNFLLNSIKTIWNAIWAVVKWVWENIALPIFNAIKWVIDNVLIPGFNGLLSVIKFVWDAIGTVISFVWNVIIKPLWTAIKWTIDNVLLPAFRLIQSTIKTVWDAIGVTISGAWNNVIKPLWEGIKKFINEILLPAFDTLKTGLSDIWDGIKSTAATAWDGIVKVLKGAVNTAIRVVNTLIDGINAIGKLPGISINIAHIPELAKGGLLNVAPGLKNADAYAAGGRVDPTASKVGAGFRTNRVRAIVGEGNPIYPEYVIPTDPTYRGRARMLANSLVNELGMEVVPPQFAFGGILDTVGDAWDATGGKVATGIRKGATMAAFAPFNALADQLIKMIPVDIVKRGARFAKNTVYNWVKGTEDKVPEAPQLSSGIGYLSMFAALRQKFPHAKLFSGYRPGAITATGNPSYHGMGRAIDTNPDMQMFNWLLDNYGSASKEIIFSPANQRQIRNGRSHMYTGVTRGDHWDHIHWAMAQGGIIPSLANGGIVYPRPGGTLIRAGERGQREAVVPLPRDFSSGTTELHFYGDLSFPNITSGDDAEELIRNLESLAD